MIKQFDKATCRRLGEDIAAALKPVAEKHGLTVRGKGGTFTPTEFTSRFQFAVTETASGKSKEQDDFERQCSLYDLKPEDYGRTFKFRGARWRLVGFELKRRKFPIRGVNVETGVTRLYQEAVLKTLEERA